MSQQDGIQYSHLAREIGTVWRTKKKCYTILWTGSLLPNGKYTHGNSSQNMPHPLPYNRASVRRRSLRHHAIGSLPRRPPLGLAPASGRGANGTDDSRTSHRRSVACMRWRTIVALFRCVCKHRERERESQRTRDSIENRGSENSI